MSAIDLNTRQLMWQVPMGSVEDTGPLGLKTHMHILLGMRRWAAQRPASGLVFFAGTVITTCARWIPLPVKSYGALVCR